MIRTLLSLAIVTIFAQSVSAQPGNPQPQIIKHGSGASLTLPGFPLKTSSGFGAAKTGAVEAMIRVHDKNDDHKLNADECPASFRASFGTLDLNHDGYLNEHELAFGLGIGAANSPIKRGKVIANFLYTVTDDFIVDVWHNGEKLADSRREMTAETFGATDEKINIEVREGDWLVFNVVNNRLRWGGVSYFAVAGMTTGNGVGFASNFRSPRWTYCDDPSQVNAFITDPTFLSGQVVRPSTGKWDRGETRINALTDGWKGTSVWGNARNTWIRYTAPSPDGNALP